jgi:hypothetical protein
MNEPLDSFHSGDRVRYNGEQEVADGQEGPCVLVARGMIGHVLKGPEMRDGAPHTPPAPSYLIMFGGRCAWLRAERLERE